MEVDLIETVDLPATELLGIGIALYIFAAACLFLPVLHALHLSQQRTQALLEQLASAEAVNLTVTEEGVKRAAEARQLAEELEHAKVREARQHDVIRRVLQPDLCTAVAKATTTVIEEHIVEIVQQLQTGLGQQVMGPGLCALCMEAPATVVYMACTHLCCCTSCHERMKYARECPICRSLGDTMSVILATSS